MEARINKIVISELAAIDYIAHGPSPFPSIHVGCFEGMGGVVGTARDAYGVR